MAVLACDICGGKLSIGSGGIALCDSCGMEHTKDRMQEKIHEIKGTVKVDETDKAKNWYKLADAAYDNSNYDEAYNYYCKVLEVRVEDWIATYRKGFCLGWKSTLANIRGNEVLGGITNAAQQLMGSDTISDMHKANGMSMMAIELHNWISAINRMVVNQANEYGDTLISAVNEFYDREQLISQMIGYNLALFNEHMILNVEDIDQAETVLDAVVQSGYSVIENLNHRFSVNSGSNYNEFQGRYVDEYITVPPSASATNASNTLTRNIKEAKQLFTKVSQKREELAQKAVMDKFNEKNPDEYGLYYRKMTELAERTVDLEGAKKVLEDNRAKQKSKRRMSDDNKKKIKTYEDEIEKLRNKIFGKKKAAEEVVQLESRIAGLNEQIKEFSAESDNLGKIIDDQQMIVIEKKSEIQLIIDHLNKIITENEVEIASYKTNF